MSGVWRDRQNRRLFTGLLLLLWALAGLGVLYCAGQTQRVQALLLQHDEAVAGALLEQGVPPQAVAAALSGEGDRARGAALLRQMGLTARTPPWLLEPVRAFGQGALIALFAGAAPGLGAVLALVLRFLRRRDRSLCEAAAVVRRFADGDFTKRLPRFEEGALPRFYAAVDGLATALRAQNERERETKEFLKRTISDISHQLKTPLAALGLYHEIILSEPEDPDTVRAFAQKAGASLDRMERLLGALLKITRLDAGGVVFEKTRCRVTVLLERATEALATRAARERKRILWSGDPEETVFCDLLWTGEAVGNLVKNALDHTEAGGRIRLSWERAPAMTRLTVADDGCGIAPEDLHHIFKRFYRSGRSMDRQGTGLGLPLAKTIIERQGGVLSVQSAPGAGAAFSVAFPTEP